MITLDIVKSALGTQLTTLSIDYPLASESQGTPPNTASSCYVAIIAWTSASPVTVTTPSGWTNVLTVGASGETQLALYYKAYDASTSAVSFVGSGSTTKFEGIVTLWSGVNLTTPNPITVSTSSSGGASSTHSIGPITTAYDNSMLLGGWMTPDTPGYFNTTTGMSTAYVGVSRTSTGGAGLYVAWKAQGTAGSSGVQGTNSFNADTQNLYSVNDRKFLAAINPYLGPTAPVLGQPDGGNQITVNATYSINWTASTSPTVAQSSLQYHIQYSDNDGASWSDIVALTSAGVTTYSWNTTGRSVGVLYRVRIRAWDGTQFGPYDTSGSAFSIIADQAPGAPTNPQTQQPAGTPVTVADRAAGIRFVWTHNDIGDPQTGYEIRHSANADMTSPTTVTNTSANQYHDFASSTFAYGTRYWDVRTKDTAGTYGPRTATQSFLAGNKPATPNITAPTAASPPASSTPTITWTSSGQTQYRYRWLLDSNGSQVYDSGYVASTTQSVVSAYFVSDGVAVRLKLSIKNSDGLASNEDSETMTPSFTGPAQPTVTVTDAGEFLQVVIANSDTPDHNDLYKDGVRIAEGMAVDGSFNDYNVADGVTYSYVARAVSVSDLITDSDPDTGALTLGLLWIHVPTKSSTSTNAVGSVGLIIIPPLVRERTRAMALKRCSGRNAPLAVFGQAVRHRLYTQCRLPISEISKLDSLKQAYSTNADICARDPQSNRIFGRIKSLAINEMPSHVDITLEIFETDYDEEVT